VFSDRLLEHLRAPRHVGELAPPAISAEVSNPACGDILRLSAVIEGGRIVEARYRVRGCTASIAAGSALTEMIAGETVDALGTISAVDIEERLGGLPAASKHAAALCVDGLRALLKLSGARTD
jgi:nitrogen fixation NifU-like protein